MVEHNCKTDVFLIFYSVVFRKNRIDCIFFGTLFYFCETNINERKCIAMSNTIKIHDKTFTRTIAHQEIAGEVKRVAEQINKDYAGKNPLLLAVLNGSFMFAAELMKHLDLGCEVSFVKLSSYQGTNSTGVIREVIGLSESITGRDVIIVEDIVDTGYTMQNMLETLGTREPNSIAIASLFVKPARLQVPVDVKYSVFTIPDRFIVGFGLDYDGLGRNLPDIYDVVEE